MDEHLDNYVAQIGSYNPQALAAYKKISWEGTEHWGHFARRAGRKLPERLYFLSSHKKLCKNLKNKIMDFLSFLGGNGLFVILANRFSNYLFLQ